MSWDDVSYVIRSKTRQAVLEALERPKTPTLVTQELHTSIANISRALRELKSVGLIELATPTAKTGRVYRINARGKVVLQKVLDMRNPVT
jgi:predicted transcriptional regulator